MDIIISFIIAIASLLVIMKAASYAITAISNYAKTTGISEYLIGFLVVSIGTSLPELSTAIMGSLANQSKLILGDLIGANIIDVTLVLGLTAIIGKKIVIEGDAIDKTFLTTIALVILPLILGFDGKFQRFDGLILLGAFAIYIFRLIKKEGTLGRIKKSISIKDIWKDMLVFLGSMFALLLSAKWFLISCFQISNYFGIPTFIMGLVFVAIGTTVPELTVSIRSVLKGHHHIGFGNILGSIIANITLVLGIAALINPISFDKTRFITSALFMLTSVVIAILFLKKKTITWQEGVALLLVYITFLVSEGILFLF